MQDISRTIDGLLGHLEESKTLDQNMSHKHDTKYMRRSINTVWKVLNKLVLTD